MHTCIYNTVMIYYDVLCTRLTKIRENSKGLKDLYTHTFLYVKLKSFLGLNLSKGSTGTKSQNSV